MATILTIAFAFGSAVYAFSNRYLLVAVVILFYILVQRLWQWRRQHQFMQQAIISYAGHTLKLNAFLDSGNALVDPESQMPVSIISLAVFLQMFPNITADQILLHELDQVITDGHYVDCQTISGKSKVFVFSPDQMQINGNIIECSLLGVTAQSLRNSPYDALLNVKLGGWL